MSPAQASPPSSDQQPSSIIAPATNATTHSQNVSSTGPSIHLLPPAAQDTAEPLNSSRLATTPRPAAGVRQKNSQPFYITLTISRPGEIYTTLVLLGNDFPSTTPTEIPPTSPPRSKAQTPGIPTGSIVGIVVGCVVGFGLLAGVFYIYLLRMRQYRRISRRKRSRRGSSSTGNGGSAAGAAPPPAPEPPPPPPPPPPP